MFQFGTYFLYVLVACNLCSMVQSQDSRIPPGFERVGSRFFYIENNEWKTWTDAKSSCRQKGGHLAAFTSIDEMHAIHDKLIKGNGYWLGINELANEGNYISEASGKRASLLKWWPGEPNDRYSKEDCVGMMNAHMYDWSCEYKMHFICQLDNFV